MQDDGCVLRARVHNPSSCGGRNNNNNNGEWPPCNDGHHRPVLSGWPDWKRLGRLGQLLAMCLPFLLLLDNCFSCLQPNTVRLQLFCQSVCTVFAFVLHLLSFMSTYVKHCCYRRKSRFAIQCRRVGRQCCTSHRRKRSLHVQSRFALRPHIVFLPVVQSIAVWFLSSKTMNRIMHSLVGNISMKQLMEVLQNKLGEGYDSSSVGFLC